METWRRFERPLGVGRRFDGGVCMSREVLSRLQIAGINAGAASGRSWLAANGEALEARSPIDGSALASINTASAADVAKVIERANEAFLHWRLVPAPRRGEFV